MPRNYMTADDVFALAKTEPDAWLALEYVDPYDGRKRWVHDTAKRIASLLRNSKGIAKNRARRNPSAGVETWPQWRDRLVQEKMVEYECSREDAEDIASGEWREWQEAVLAALKAGWIPSQAWINSTLTNAGEWWERRIIHDHPNIAERLVRSDRSPLMSKAELATVWERNQG